LFFAIVSTAIVFIVYLLIGPIYLGRRLRIKDKRNWLFAEGRNKFFVTIEIAFIALFLITGYININLVNPLDLSAYMVTGLLFLISVSQGIEEWIFYRKDKVYYHRFVQACALLCLMVLFSFDKWVV